MSEVKRRTISTGEEAHVHCYTAVATPSYKTQNGYGRLAASLILKRFPPRAASPAGRRTGVSTNIILLFAHHTSKRFPTFVCLLSVQGVCVCGWVWMCFLLWVLWVLCVCVLGLVRGIIRDDDDDDAREKPMDQLPRRGPSSLQCPKYRTSTAAKSPKVTSVMNRHKDNV